MDRRLSDVIFSDVGGGLREVPDLNLVVHDWRHTQMNLIVSKARSASGRTSPEYLLLPLDFTKRTVDRVKNRLC